jgi:LPXTG-motif cell wall-anchored protein
MEESKKNKLFIGAGLLLIALGLYVYRNKSNNKKEINKSNNKSNDLPKRFIEDVKNMSLDELNDSIESNKTLLNKKGLSASEKEAIEKMLNYVSEQIENKK